LLLAPSGITPFDLFESLEAPNQQIEDEAYQANHQHPGNDQIVSLPGVSGIYDQVPQSGVNCDHLGRDNNEPGNTQRDAQTRDYLGQAGR
jgi:hypothetical protein